MVQVTWHIHKRQFLGAHELNRRRTEQTIVLFTNKARILNGLMRYSTDIRIRTNNAHIVLRLRSTHITQSSCSCAVRQVAQRAFLGCHTRATQSNVLTDQHADTDTRHVEPIKELLHIHLVLLAPHRTFVVQYTLRQRCHHTIMPMLDTLQAPCKVLIVLNYILRPVNIIQTRLCAIVQHKPSSLRTVRRGGAPARQMGLRHTVFQLGDGLKTRIRRSQHFIIIFHRMCLAQSPLDRFRESWSRERNEFLKRLGVPVPDFDNRWCIRKLRRQFMQILHTMSQTHRQLLCMSAWPCTYPSRTN